MSEESDRQVIAPVISLDEFKHGKVCDGCAQRADGCTCGIDPNECEGDNPYYDTWGMD